MPLSVDAELLTTLLARGAESDDLDYKSTWAPGQRAELVELCKDIAAMESLTNGGYIVIGADDHGAPSGTFSPADTSAFDEQRVRSRAASVLGEPIDLSCALHELDGHTFAVIGIGPNRDGMRIMPRDGEYPGTTVWRAGDVFVRRGTSSIRWNQHEARGIIERVVAARKEEWRQDVFDTIRAATPAYEAGGFVNINVEMPADGFAAAITELLRRHDDIGLDLLTRKTITAAVGIVDGIGPDSDLSAVASELSDQLDRLGVIAVLSARYSSPAFAQTLDGYQRIYDAIDSETDIDYPRFFPQGQREVITHIYAVGAALVVDRRWIELSGLARLAPAKTGNGFWKTLLRKAEVRIARANLLQDESGARIGLIEAAKPIAARLSNLLGDADSPDLTSLLVEFDVYRAIATSENARMGSYPNFALYYAARGERAFLKLLEDQVARAALFEGDDEQLARLFALIDGTAQREAFRYNGWDGFDDARIRAFIDQHRE